MKRYVAHALILVFPFFDIQAPIAVGNPTIAGDGFTPIALPSTIRPLSIGIITNNIFPEDGTVLQSVSTQLPIVIDPGKNDVTTWYGQGAQFDRLWARNTTTGNDEILLRNLNPLPLDVPAYTQLRFIKTTQGIKVQAELTGVTTDGTPWVYSTQIISDDYLKNNNNRVVQQVVYAGGTGPNYSVTDVPKILNINLANPDLFSLTLCVNISVRSALDFIDMATGSIADPVGLAQAVKIEGLDIFNLKTGRYGSDPVEIKFFENQMRSSTANPGAQ